VKPRIAFGSTGFFVIFWRISFYLLFLQGEKMGA
jgi:hypothetical protein